jgi:hypothetical protein
VLLSIPLFRDDVASPVKRIPTFQGNLVIFKCR